MLGPVFVVLAQNPDWWYESWSAGQWLQSLFNQPLEVHTFVLGVFVGVLLASLAISRKPEIELTLTLVVLLFTFGAFEPVFGSRNYTAFRHVKIKPWYFLGGYLLTYLGTLSVLRAIKGSIPATPIENRAASRFAGVVLLALIGAALYSFVFTGVVHPVTGLATIGGLFGAAIGLVAYEWAIATDEGVADLPVAARRVLWHDIDTSVYHLGYGAAFGFGYPWLFWELGVVIGREGFLFGKLVMLPGWVSVVTYVVTLFVFSLVILRALRGSTIRSGGEGHHAAALVFGYVCYGSCLFIATGLAGAVWFRSFPVPPT